MAELDPRSKAAECDRAIEVVADPERRLVFQRLRSVWIALGNPLSFLDAPLRPEQLSIIAQIHAELMSGCRMAMH